MTPSHAQDDIDFSETVYEWLSASSVFCEPVAGARRIECDGKCEPWRFVVLVGQAYSTSLSMTDSLCKRLKNFFVNEIEPLLHLRRRRPFVNMSVQRAFEADYVGDLSLPRQLFDYISACWLDAISEEHKYPYTTIVQSSGFGKSRLVRELAKLTASMKDTDATMRVMYLCMNTNKSLPSYPQATSSLCEDFFPKSNYLEKCGLYDRVLGLVTYALENWETVGGEWSKLLDDDDESEHELSVRRTLRNHIRRQRASEAAEAEPVSQTNLRTISRDQLKLGPDDHNVDRKEPWRRIVVLAIDKARALWPKENEREGWFHKLRRVLHKVSRHTLYKYGVGIFSLFVDTKPCVCELGPPRGSYHSGWDMRRELAMQYPPFVLTQTMDLFFHVKATEAQKAGKTCIEFYDELLCVADRNLTWANLLLVGRPLWQSIAYAGHAGRGRVIEMAAYKLLADHPAIQRQSFTASTKFGVASALCRLGCAPRIECALAFKLVTDFMAVLAYVSQGPQQSALVTYSSDPILALGAAYVWYGDGKERGDFDMLGLMILPQLRRLVVQDELATDSPRSLATRTLLLMAMDAACLFDTSTAVAKRGYDGGWYSAANFFHALIGDRVRIRPITATKKRRRSEAAVMSTRTVIADLAQWQVGFAQFLELSQDDISDVSLRALLVRRAAAVLPRKSSRFVELVVPMMLRSADDSSSVRVAKIVVRVAEASVDTRTLLLHLIPWARMPVPT